jgi:hypothetical protein
MQKRLWWLLGGCGLLLAGWLGYQHWQRTHASVADAVPPDALLMIESSVLQTATPASSRQASLRQLPVFAVALSRLQRLFAATSPTDSVQAFLRRKAIRYSLHPVSKSELDFIFYVPIGATDAAFLGTFRQPDPTRFRTLSRQFDGRTIYELRDRSNQIYGAYLLTDTYLIGSPSGVLLENVVRQLNKPFGFGSGIELPQSADNVASVYVRPDVLTELVGSSKTTGSLLQVFIPESLTLQFRRSASPSHWLGFGTDPLGNRQAVAQLFKGQTPHRIRAPNLIPQQTATLYHVSLSNVPAFGNAVVGLLKASDNEQLKRRIKRTETLLPRFYQQLAGDIVLCREETAAGKRAGQVLLLEATNATALSKTIQEIAYALSGRSSVPRNLLNHKLLPLQTDELPATLLSTLFAGFQDTWITQHGAYVVLASSEEALQTYLLALQTNAVWGNDSRMVTMTAETLRPAHLTTFTRLPRSGSAFLQQWPANWQALLGPAPFANAENLAYQATYSPEHIFSTVVIGRSTQQADATMQNRLLLRKRIPFNASLVASPVVVGNLADPSAQIWAQNSAQQFVLLTTEKDKIVQDTTDGPIQSNVVAADWRNNGRLQYLFATKQSLYVADLGNKRVQLQRIALPPGLETRYIGLPSGSNRQPDLVALMAHRDGSIYALDRKKQRLARLFMPARTGTLLLPFQVIDRSGRLEVLGLQTNRLLNRWQVQAGQASGQVPPFPVSLAPADSSTFAGPCLWLPAQRHIVTITEAGELLTLSENGQVIGRKQLYRPLRGGQFRLFPDVEQTGYVLLRTTDAEATVLDAAGNRLFELRGLEPTQSHVQYHRLGAGVELLAVKSGGFTTLYNLKGQRIGDRPIPSDFPVTLQLDDQTNELYIVSSIQKAVQLFSIRLQ